MTDVFDSLLEMLGDGHGKFSSSDAYRVGRYPQAQALADFNSDGHMDIVTGDFVFEDVSVLLGNGDGGFDSGLSFGLVQRASSITTGDFDGDGRADIVGASRNDIDDATSVDGNAVSILLNRTNRPPHADGGPEQLQECSSPHGSSITLDGNGSSDPDGDKISFSWSSPVVVLVDPNAGATSGLFPLGETAVTLLVSDGEFEDLDNLNVTVVDTLPPSMTLSLELVDWNRDKKVNHHPQDDDSRGSDDDDETGHRGNGHDHDDDDDYGGQSGNHGERKWLKAQFSASDICDATPTITAELQLGSCGTLPVSSGQVIRFKQSVRCRTREKKGVLKIEAPSLALHVTASDDSGNSRIVTKVSGPTQVRAEKKFPNSPLSSFE